MLCYNDIQWPAYSTLPASTLLVVHERHVTMMCSGLPFHCVWLLAWQSLKNKVKPVGGHAQKVNVLVKVPIASDTYKFVMNRSFSNYCRNNRSIAKGKFNPSLVGFF